jgi:hypothetical protein
MNNLDWLEKTDREKLFRTLTNTAEKELQDRFWGNHCNGNSKCGAPRIFVNDPRGIAMVAGLFRYILNQMDSDIFYRGQKQDHRLIVSAFRGLKRKEDRSNRNILFLKAMSDIKPVFDPRGSDDEREALSQHYGMKTRWLDVVDNIQSAAWFASDLAPEQHRDGAVGYIYLIAVPRETTSVCRIIDLRKKPSQWLRPHIQQAFSIRAEDPISYGGELKQFHLLTMVIPQFVLINWSCRRYLTDDIFFPNMEQDAGARFWSKASSVLTAAPKYSVFI